MQTEETLNSSPSVISAIPWPILILMGIVLIGMLYVLWKSNRDKK